MTHGTKKTWSKRNNKWDKGVSGVLGVFGVFDVFGVFGVSGVSGVFGVFGVSVCFFVPSSAFLFRPDVLFLSRFLFFCPDVVFFCPACVFCPVCVFFVPLPPEHPTAVEPRPPTTPRVWIEGGGVCSAV